MKKNSPSGARPSLGKRKTDNFSKFYNKKRNSAIKEGLRQEKKAEKKERKEAIERSFEERRKSRSQPPAPGRSQWPQGGRPQRPAPAPGRPIPGKTTPAPGRPIPGKTAPASGRPIPATGKPIHGKAAPTPAHTSGARPAPAPHATGETLPLNKYISNGGICSRRDAADLVRNGKVTVNGQLVTEPGTKVHPSDTIKVGNKKVTISSNFVYILLNKPKDYITTTEDPQGRRTVLDLIRSATTERVYPIGRLDRNTSGVLLFTNDGDLSQKLAHPSHQIRKIYHVTLDKPLTKADFDKIASGSIVLEDGPAPVDDLAYADPKDRTQIGIEIHTGRNRIVRRLFEHLQYDVRGLDRVMYAGLTKKNVQRGHWRLLNEKEIRILKYLNSSIKGSPGRAKDLAPETTVPEQPARPTQPTRAARPNRPERPNRPAQPSRPARPSGSERPSRPARPSGPAQQSRPTRPGGPARPAPTDSKRAPAHPKSLYRKKH
jgi:23S rRNA pseudouridine2605 synthase